MSDKIYTIQKEVIELNKTRTYTLSGTLPELIEKFSYTLEIGHSHKKSIKTNPSTIRGLISALNRSGEVINACRYTQYFYSLVK